ncbi:MAG TPA: DUF4389 domain-containing protein [Acidimicrobiia bacterium]
MSKGKIAAVIVGAIMGLVGLGFLLGGAGLLWANETQQTDDGFFTTEEISLSTDSYALTSADVDLGAQPGDWFPSGRLATVRLDVEGETEVFVGIGPEDEVEAYLDEVAHTEVTRMITDDDARYRDIGGDQTPATPLEQPFWVASVNGPGPQTLTWDLEAGRWMVVIMNADATSGIAVEASAGARTDLLVPIALGLLAIGAILAIIALVLIVTGIRGSVAAPLAPTGEAGEFGPYPVRVEGELDPKLSRWQWLFKWLLLIPHFVALAFLWTAFVLLSIVAWFAILFTGHYPRSIFDFNVGVLRWSWRVSYYSYGALGTDQYPPFTLAETDYPAHFDVEYPERLSRGLALVKTWLLAIPHYLIVGLFTSGLIYWTTEIGPYETPMLEFGAGLIGILVFIAAIVLLFSGRYPKGLFDLVMGLNRWVFRVVAYAALMRDEYPPFRLDTGGSEPGATPPGGPTPSDGEGSVPQQPLPTRP